MQTAIKTNSSIVNLIQGYGHEQVDLSTLTQILVQCRQTGHCGLNAQGLTDWQGCISEINKGGVTATVQVWAGALYQTWIDCITLEELKHGLAQILYPAPFSSAEIATAADPFFLEIVITVETSRLQQSYDFDGSAPVPDVSNFVCMTSNHKSRNTGQGTSELVSDSLSPNESIHWTAVSKNGKDTIQLCGFFLSPVSEGHARIDSLITTPQPVSNTTNQYKCRVLSDPESDIEWAYRFEFTVNNGTQKFTFDPYLGDQNSY
ncbi:hypothetical protein [Pseudoalteromonas aurantia]|uniref:Ig-like domain-containing protein n=1 Tax=Pseudoalteromonas aurantia 208 TaxID=1314867 RepID=A0ABR9EBH6_9GAMM|nr:hypothetical protein [Pseudoalteromonas aurantia]MBE0368182.1 hypothetical protein [Pseudoalteromonas aurantia 208]